MDQSSWEQLQHIFHAALDLDPAQRPAYLDDACRGHVALRQHVERMLAVPVGDSFVREPLERAHDAIEATSHRDLPPPLPEEVVFPSGRYRVLRTVGAGGMGQVGEAVDVDRGTRVAIKSLSRLTPTAIYQFKREFRTLAGVSHANLVTLHELANTGEQWLLSMEFVDGVDFTSYVRPQPHRGCDIGRLRSALAQLVAAIRHLHDQGILHRDLKPSNVLVAADGRVAVLDFGLATEFADEVDGRASAFSGTFGGTVRYMSPEQSRGEPLSPASDWYTAGVMVYEALTGHPPFQGTATEILRDKGTVDPPAPSTVVSDVPQDLDELCMAWLSRDPAKRPPGLTAPLLPPAAPTLPGARTHSVPPPKGVFVGRELELLALHDAWAVTQRDTPCVALVHGPSGMGKSALISRFKTDIARDPNVLVLEGRCFERESVPFKAFDALIDALSAHLRRVPPAECARLLPPAVAALARVFPVLRSVPAIASNASGFDIADDEGDRRRDAFNVLRDLLARIGRRWRLVLAVDDLQWADTDSAALLQAVFRSPGAPPLLFIAVYRSGPEHEDTTAFLREFLQAKSSDRAAIGREIPIGPMSATELFRLAAETAPDLSVDARTTLAEESAGSPYFMVELLSTDQSESTRPSTLDGILRQRAEALPVTARQLLRTVAVARHPVAEHDACDAAGLGSDRVAVLALLRAQRLVRGSARGTTREIACWHDRVREAVTSRLTEEEWRGHHASLAVTFEASGTADTERVATHFDGAGQHETAARYFARAARSSLDALAFDHAAELFTKALSRGTFVGDERHQLLAGRAEALDYAGRGPEAARAYEQAAHDLVEAGLLEDTSPRLGEYERRAAYWYMNSGHSSEGRRIFATMLHRVGLTMPASPTSALLALAASELRLRVRGLRYTERAARDIPRIQIDRVDITKDAAGSIITADIIAGAYFNTRSLLLALDAGEPNRIAYMLMLQVVSASIVGPRMRARRERYRAVAATLEAKVADPVVRAAFRWGDGTVRFFVGEFSAAVDDLEAGLLMLQRDCRGQTREAAQAELILQVTRLHLGQYRAVLEAMEHATERASQRGDLFLTAASAVFHAEAALLLGELNLATRSLERAAACLTEPGFHTVHARLALGRARLALALGDAERARVLLETEWPRLRRHFFLQSENFWQWSYFTRASIYLACAVGSERSAMIAAAEEDARRIDRDPLTWSRSFALLIRAGCAARLGSSDHAVSCLREAARTTQMPMVAAAARLRLGGITGGDLGRAECDAAHALMDANGVHDHAHLTAAFVPLPD